MTAYGHQSNTLPSSELLDGFEENYASPQQQDQVLAKAVDMVIDMLAVPYQYPPLVGCCPVAICPNLLRQGLHQQAYADIMYKLQQGYKKQLWQMVPKGQKRVAHPVRAAQQTSEADLVACIRAAVKPTVPSALGMLQYLSRQLYILYMDYMIYKHLLARCMHDSVYARMLSQCSPQDAVYLANLVCA